MPVNKKIIAYLLAMTLIGAVIPVAKAQAFGFGDIQNQISTISQKINELTSQIFQIFAPNQKVSKKAVCGNGACEPGETAVSCFGDCGVYDTTTCAVDSDCVKIGCDGCANHNFGSAVVCNNPTIDYSCVCHNGLCENGNSIDNHQLFGDSTVTDGKTAKSDAVLPQDRKNYYDAIQSDELIMCDRLISEQRTGCYLAVEARRMDSEANKCAGVGINYEDDCYGAIAKMDSSNCDKLSDVKTLFYYDEASNIKITFKDFCYHEVAKVKKDVSVCAKISATGERDDCYFSNDFLIKDPGVCSSIGGLDLRDQCYYSVGTHQKNPLACDKISGTKFQDICRKDINSNVNSVNMSVVSTCGNDICDNTETAQNCPQDCGANLFTGCLKEGVGRMVGPNPQCCAGLKSISTNRPDLRGNCSIYSANTPIPGGFGGICAKCGDSVCGAGENICNCPADCKNTDCAKEGQIIPADWALDAHSDIKASFCCAGLIPYGGANDSVQNGVCVRNKYTVMNGSYRCLKCGDKICNTAAGEDICSCPQDCK